MSEQKTSSRRALMKGVAWAAPVAAVAVAAPALAMSKTTTIVVGGDSCQDNTYNHFYLVFTITNAWNIPLEFTFGEILGTTTNGTFDFPLPNEPFTLPGNGSKTFRICSNTTPNNSIGKLRFTGTATNPADENPGAVVDNFDVTPYEGRAFPNCRSAKPCSGGPAVLS